MFIYGHIYSRGLITAAFGSDATVYPSRQDTSQVTACEDSSKMDKNTRPSMKVAVVIVLLAVGVGLPVFADDQSLFYIYTALSKPLNLPGIYEFTALGMLNDKLLDYYNSEDQVKIPMQTWMEERMPEDYWDKGTQSRKSKEQWFKVNVEILMDRMKHNKSDLHVLQWRHGCVIEETDGNVNFKKGIDEYSYDGSEFLSFDDKNSRWIAPVQAAEPTKRKWDGVDILNQYTKSYLEKECVKWLTEFKDYGKETLQKHSPPDVYKFTRKYLRDSNQLILTCMATGFYPPDVKIYVRKYRTTLPEHIVTSSGVRPNGDGTYQMRKSVVVSQKDIDAYDCYVMHSTLLEPIIINGVSIDCPDCPPVAPVMMIGIVIGVVIMLVVAVVIFVLAKQGIIRTPIFNGSQEVNHNGNGHVYSLTPTENKHHIDGTV